MWRPRRLLSEVSPASWSRRHPPPTPRCSNSRRARPNAPGAKNGSTPYSHLAVIDYSLPSTQRRLWVFDVERGRLLFEELVAHGRNTGDTAAEHFSNIEGSKMSSVGLFQTAETYYGSNGYSLRLRGLDPGFNDNALSRAIVMHGAPYVSQAIADRLGRLGRSWGCPAVRQEVARTVIDTLKGGALLFAYYPDRKWLAESPYFQCDAAPAERVLRAELDLPRSPGRG